MAPGVGGKRKRGDRTWSGDSNNDGQRPSPHRPGNLNLAHQHQQNQGHGREQHDHRGRGGRRPSRGNTRGGARSPVSGAPKMDPPPAKASSPVRSTTSRDQTAVQPTSTTTPAVLKTTAPNSVLEAPKSPPVPFDYEYVTLHNAQAWQSSGRQSVVDAGLAAKQAEDSLLLNSVFQEVVRAALDGRIAAADAGSTIKDIIGQETAPEDKVSGAEDGERLPSFDPQSLFLDTLSVLTDADMSNSKLPELLFATAISPVIMRQQLETPLLESLGMIRSTFARMGIRKQTNLLYRQANYNLLREESEGFAKLITELFTTSGNEPPSGEVVEDTFERVKGMIGAFDLDVGRVLDITLDVFAAVLVKQNRFFVKFLRTSSWWPKDDDNGRTKDKASRIGGLPKWALPGASGWTTTEADREEFQRLSEVRDTAFWERARATGLKAFFEIGRHRINDEERERLLSKDNASIGSEDDEARRWIEQTGTMPPKGNRIAAQLLGFKLRFYSSDARSPHDVLPENLIYLSALLIKVGFISLHDLYPHLWRSDDDMEPLRLEKLKEKAERERAAKPGAGLRNALLSAGALSDDTVPAPLPSRLREAEGRGDTPAKEQEPEKLTVNATESQEALPEPSDQKVSLLKSLLAIGAVPESLYILGRFPWLVDLYPELPEYIHRIIHHSLSKIYSPLTPVPDRDSLREQQKPTDPDQTGVPKGNIRLTDAPVRRVLRWALLDREDSSLDGQNYRFYWDDWSDTVPVCQSVDDMFVLCHTLLNLTGVKVGQDPSLLMKFARIGKDSLNKDKSAENLSRWGDFCKRILVPALSLTKGNPGVVNEVFELLSAFPRDSRFLIYTEWFSGQISKLPDIRAAFDLAKAETKDVLKRISKTNLRPMGRALAKIAFGNPHIVINVAIGQIEAYENLAEVVVECARYFTYLGYDVLTWSLISSLSRAGRSRVQSESGGMTTSRWLTALALFTGKAFKRYSILNPTPVLQYVAEQLRLGNSTDLIVLEQIVLFMAGIVTDTNFNDAQIQAMAGGELLQSQTVLQLQDKRHDSRTTAKRLMKHLIDSKLAGQLLLTIAQQRRTCVYSSDLSDAPLKLLGNIFDEIHRVLTQYVDLLRSNLSLQDFSAIVPDVTQLILNYGLETEVAFWISRPTIAQQMIDVEKAAQDDAETKKEDPQLLKDSNGDLEMTDEGNTATAEERSSGAQHDISIRTPSETAIPAGTASAGSPVPNGESAATTPPRTAFSWQPVLQNIMDAFEIDLPGEVWETVGLPFYVTFWQLSLYDVHIPGKSYEDEIERQKKKVAQITNDRSHVSSVELKRREQEKKQLTELQEKLLAENKRHLKSYSESRSRLQKEKDHWFAGMKGKYEALNMALIERCFLPRLLLSPIDSFFCFKVVKFLHSNGTPNFRTLGFFDLIFREDRLTSLMFLCSSKEADNLGRFLGDVLRDLSRWHGDKALYEKEAYGPKRDLPGFATKLDDDGKPVSLLDYEDFRRILYKWHRLLHNALKTCLNSTEYMHIRNAISVLKAVIHSFPAVNWIGKELQKCVTVLRESALADVRVPSAALMGDLNRREKSWVFPQAFNLIESTANGITSKSQTPQPQPSTLNAAAPEFQPGTAVNGDGIESFTGANKAEVEDGEVEDAEMPDAEPKEADQKTSPGPSTDKTTEVSKTGVEQAGSTEPNEVPEEDVKHASLPGQALPGGRASPPLDAESAPSEDITGPKSVVGESDNTKPSRPDSQNAISDTAAQANLPRRPESGRGTPVSTPRSQPNLPNRPDARPLPPGDHRGPRRGPPADFEPRRDGRDTRSPEYGRHGRYGDHDRDRSFDQASGHTARSHDHRSVDRGPHFRDAMDIERTAERDHPSRAPQDDRYGRAPPREMRPPLREPEWPERSSRLRPPLSDPYANRQDQDRPRDAQIGPLRSGPPQPSDRSGINPERAALINGSDDKRRPETMRSNSEDRRSRGSRQASPSPADDRRAPPRYDRRDEGPQQDDRRGGNFQQGPNTRSDGGSSSRTDRHGPPSGYPPNDFPRDSRPLHSRQSNIDMNHGRLNQDSRFQGQQLDSSDDRYSSPKDAPSGPRGRYPAGRGGRTAPPSQPHINTQVSQPSLAPSPNVSERQPPTGPGGRSHGRNASQNEQVPSTPATPSTPAPDTAGVHPDRLQHIAGLSPTSNAQSRPAPLQTNQASLPSNQPSPSPSTVPPSGPRSSATLPSPTSRGPPSGPAFPERGNRTNRHPLTAVNNTLQQASVGPSDRGGQGTSIRGRGAMRQGQGPPMSHSSGPPTPVTQRSEAFAPIPDTGDDARPDLFAHRASGGAGPPQRPPRMEGEPRSGPPRSSGRRGDLISEEGADSRRSTRHSSSRTHSAERDRERDHEGSRHRRGEDDSSSTRRDDHHRDRDARRDHERDRDGRRGGGGDPSDREHSSRRDPSHDEQGPLRRRDRRGDKDDQGDAYESRGPPAPPPPGPYPGQGDRRYGSGRGSGDRDREPHDHRGGDSRRDSGAPPPPSLSGGPNAPLPPRKRGRPPGSDDPQGGYGGGSGGVGMRVGSESKRFRRGQ